MRRQIVIMFVIALVACISLPPPAHCSDDRALRLPLIGDFDPPGGYIEPRRMQIIDAEPKLIRLHSCPSDPELDNLSSPDSRIKDIPKSPATGATDAFETQEPRSSTTNDPDDSQELRSAWQLWHRRVDEAVFVRFDGVAQRAFANSRPFSCEAAYTVTHDRQIINVRLLKKSHNIVYNSMLLMVLKSMNGNPLLEFPSGSKREFVEKTGVFTRNCGICDPPCETEDQAIRNMLNERSLRKPENSDRSSSKQKNW